MTTRTSTQCADGVVAAAVAKRRAESSSISKLGHGSGPSVGANALLHALTTVFGGDVACSVVQVTLPWHAACQRLSGSLEYGRWTEGEVACVWVADELCPRERRWSPQLRSGRVKEQHAVAESHLGQSRSQPPRCEFRAPQGAVIEMNLTSPFLWDPSV
ncbi:hypothetical protein VTH06DRAFT_6177 [Thermothelomyces fergusii]